MENIIQLIIDSFDFGFIVVVNILTYLLIKTHDELNGDGQVPRILKRLYLIISIAIVAALIYIFDDNVVITKLLYSAIAAPVCWSWLFKPICKKLGIDYKKIDDIV